MARYSISIFAALALAVVPRIASGQSAEDSWSNLGRLRTGQKIEVVDMKLKAISGRFDGFSADSVSLRAAAGQVTIPRANVLSVKNREGSHRVRNTLLGLAIGAAGGLALGAIKGATYHESGETPVFMAVWTPIGAGIGGGFGAALPAGPVTVYRANSRPAR